MGKYTALIKKAIGYDKQRGDSVEVVNARFNKAVSEEETISDRFLQEIDWQSMITYVITAILFALFFVFGLKPLLSMLSKTVKDAEMSRGLPEGKREIEGAGGSDELPPGVSMEGAAKLGERESQLVNFAQTNPKLFAQYIKSWLQ